MQFFIHIFFVIALMVSQSATAYEVISRDYKLPSEQVRIDFSQSIYKTEATVNIQPCSTCSWVAYHINKKTELYKKTAPVNYQTFKQQVKKYRNNPPAKSYNVYLSINIKSNEVFTIKWDYVEL